MKKKNKKQICRLSDANVGTKASLSSQQETKVRVRGTSNPSVKFNRAWCLEAECASCLALLSRCKEKAPKKVKMF